jgi:diguanylate cyclase (GGDEF)-like protein
MMLDYTAIAFAFAGVCFAIGVLRYRLLEVAPIARSLLVDQMHDPVLVVDSGGRISDYNPAARALFAQQATPISGTPVSVYLPNWQQIAPLSPAKESETIFSLPENPLVRQFQMRIITISNRYGAMLGWLVILHDITEQQRLMTELEELARRDSLTGLYNRRYWVELAHAEIERSHRYGTPLAIILLDLDGFKAINDSHGHLVGDDVLKQAATAIQTSVRRVDVPARWGGDEFIILLPETSLADAELAAERLGSQLQNTDVVAQEIHFTITASLGIAGCEGKPLQLDELLECADSALYESKGKGRNRVTAVNCQGNNLITSKSPRFPGAIVFMRCARIVHVLRRTPDTFPVHCLLLCIHRWGKHSNQTLFAPCPCQPMQPGTSFHGFFPLQTPGGMIW